MFPSRQAGAVRRRTVPLCDASPAANIKNSSNISLRFAEAKKLYREGLTMKAIAEKLGFCDEHYLSKIYKRENGTNLKEDAGLV